MNRDSAPEVQRISAPAPRVPLVGALRLLGGTALLIGLALLYAGPEALRAVAQVCRSLLSV